MNNVRLTQHITEMSAHNPQSLKLKVGRLNQLINEKKLDETVAYLQKEDPEELKKLLKESDEYGDTPLHLIHNKGIDIARFILNLYKEYGIMDECYDIVNKYKETPFLHAMNTPNKEIRSMVFGDASNQENRDFFFRHVKLDYFDDVGSDHIAHQWKQTKDKVDFFLPFFTTVKTFEASQFLKSVDKEGKSFIFLFLQSDIWVDTVESLLMYDATLLLQQQKREKAYPIHVVCKHPYNCEEIIKVMIKYGGMHLLDYVDSHNKTARKYFQHHKATYEKVMKWLETNYSPEILGKKLVDDAHHTNDEVKEVSAAEILPFCALGCCIAGLNCEFPACIGCRLHGNILCLDSDIISCKMPENPAQCCLLLKGSVKCLSPRKSTFCKFAYQFCCIDALCLFPPIVVTDQDIPCMCTTCGLTICFRYQFGLFCLRRVGEIRSALFTESIQRLAALTADK